MIVASIMLSAVVYVSTFDNPPSGAGPARQDLQLKAQDVLNILYDTPVQSTLGDNALSVYINECLNDDCTNLEDALRDLAPPGAAYALYVSNGYETFPLWIEQGEPTGEATAATRSFEPAWSSTFVEPASATLGSGNPLLLYTLPIYNSNPVTPGGSQLHVKAIGTRSDGSEYVLVAGHSTQVSDSASAKAASMYFVDPATGDPLATTDVTSYTLSGGAVARVPVDFRLRVKEHEGGAAQIPAGTEVSILLPRGWTGEAVTDPGVNDGWTITAAATDEHGSYTGSAIKARLDAPLSGAEKDLVFEATYLGDVLNHYNFHAVMSNGAAAFASMIVTADAQGTANLATPNLVLSVPKPMGQDASTVWTVAVQVPRDHSSDIQALQKTVRIQRIEITEEDGNEIFATGPGNEIVAISAEGGSFENSGSVITWTGDVELDDDRLLNLSFMVKASGIAGPGAGDSYFVPPVTFDAWSGRIVTKSGPGFYRSSILPASADYEGFDPTVTGSDHTINGTSTYRTAQLPGTASYAMEDLETVTLLNDALYGSYVHVEERKVPVGGTAILNANVQSVLFALASAGQNAGVQLRIYPPWSGDARPVWYQNETSDSELLAGEVTQIVVRDLNGDGYPDPIVGTSNGRVFSLDGLTGGRLSDESFTAPLTAQAAELKLIPRINHLATWTIGSGATEQTLYVVVTDTNSEGLFVLNETLGTKWYYPLNGDGLALDTTQDVTGDGQADILVAKSFQTGGASSGIVYVLGPPTVDLPNTIDMLVAHPPTDPDALAAVSSIDSDAFYVAAGSPSVLMGIPAIGQTPEINGLAVSVQTTLDLGLGTNADPNNPQVYQSNPALPRTGLQALDSTGRPTSTFFGTPVANGAVYDYGGKHPSSDLVIGGSSGYVVMLNGSALTQPLYSITPLDEGRVISADTKAGGESYRLTLDGQVVMTDDSWQSNYCVLQCAFRAVGMNAISSNSTGHFWLVGDANGMMRTNLPDETPTFQVPYQGMPPYIPEVYVVAPTDSSTGLPYSMLTHTHNFRDILWRGTTAYVVGDKCIQVVDCDEGFVMRSTDGGSTWTVLRTGAAAPGDKLNGLVAEDLLRVRNASDGTIWIAGEGGTLLRSAATGGFDQLDVVVNGVPVTTTLRDVGCDPLDPDICVVVGDSGLVIKSVNARDASPTWTDFSENIPDTRTIYSVGFAESDRIYMGGTNAVYASFSGASWTALPLNYLQMDGTVVSTPGDGTGFVFGGGATGRIWFLHDYLPIAKSVVDLSHRLPAGATKISEVKILTSNLTLGTTTIDIEAATNGTNWQSLGIPSLDLDDVNASPRNYSFNLLPGANGVTFPTGETGGADLRLRISMETDGSQTLTTPVLRDFRVAVHYLDSGGVPQETTFWVQPEDEGAYVSAVTDEDMLAWDVDLNEIRLPYVDEYWVRNVTGSVSDLQTGYDLDADGYDEIWVGTGNVLADNSADQTIYYPDPTDVTGVDNRVRLLNGFNGEVLAESAELVGEVTHVRLADTDGDGLPNVLYATAYDASATPEASLLYSLNPETLTPFWVQPVVLNNENPADMETTYFDDQAGALGNDPGVFVGAVGVASGTTAGGHVWAINNETQLHQWAVIPDDLGKYHFEVPIREGSFFGAYVSELEVSWNQTILDADDPDCVEGSVGCTTRTALRSARFYDHFVVTQPDLLSPPSPVYSARLLMWMRDWG